MNDSGGRLISREGESCPGCLSPYTSEIGNSPTFVKRTARIIPGCSHNLCENCIAADGGSTGQVSCRHPGCSTTVAWTSGFEEFLINLFLLGSAAAYNQQTLQEGPDRESQDSVANPEPQEDSCEMMCSECREKRAECLCQKCKINLCYNCFDKIHKNIKSFENHKPCPFDNVIAEEKKEYMKISNCDEHSKMNMYIAEDGREGCDECVIFGKLKGLEVVALKDVEENTKNDLKEKIVEGKKKLANLKSVLSDFESEKNREITNSPENQAQKIKTHFSNWHSQLQTLENSLYQKLEEDQAKLDAWQADMETSVKSTQSKIKQLADIINTSEGALEKVSNPGIFDFKEMMTVLTKLVDGPSDHLKKCRPKTGNIKIEQGFVELLKSHVTLSHTFEVDQDPLLTVPADDSVENVASVPENLDSQHERLTENPLIQSATENLAIESVTEHSACDGKGDARLNGTTAPERNTRNYTADKNLKATNEVKDTNGKKSDFAIHKSKSIRKSLRDKRRPSHTKPSATTHKSSSRSKCVPSAAVEIQDGNNNANRCSVVHEADAQEIRNLPRKRVSSPTDFESSDTHKPPASKKTGKLTPSTGQCSKNVSDISYPNENTIKIKPATSKKFEIQTPEQSTSTSKKNSGVILPNQNTCKVSNDMRDCCKTKCKICNKTCSLSSMRNHTLVTHNLNNIEYKKMYGPFDIIDAVYHKCEICEKLILLDNDTLANHLKCHFPHPKIVKTYSNQNVAKRRDLNTNKCKVTQKEDSSCDSTKQAEISLDEEQINKNKTKKTGLRSQSRGNISESSVEKSKPQEESEAYITQSQLSLEKKIRNDFCIESEDEVDIIREIEAGDLKMTEMKLEILTEMKVEIPSFTDDETTTTRRINIDDNAAQVIIKDEPENEDDTIRSRSDICEETRPLI